ncbi:MAG: hypothetical protein DIU68_018065 [Chloroflexota bacterium]|nr:MAG: hypothetical protein DIU68_11135 [Chloroflexota bacterium]
MAEEKRKNTTYKTEWSFSFAELGDRISEFVQSLGVAGDEEAIKTERFTEIVGNAAAARVRLDTPVGETAVYAATDDALIDAEITHVGEIDFAVIGDTEKDVTLSQRSAAADWVRGIAGWFGSGGKLRWNVALTPNIPLELDIYSGVGRSVYSLSQMQLTKLEIHGGTGEMEVHLPQTDSILPAVINGGIGEIEVNVPPNSNIDLQLRAGTGEIELRIGENTAMNAVIKGGVGETEIRVAPGAAVRLEARIGLGNINVPSSFIQVSGSRSAIGGKGVWQSPNYETATRQINIRYDGGIGELKIR